MPLGQLLGIWIAAGLTLAIYSFLYKDNPVYKFAEHVYVGITAGYALCTAWYQVIEPNLVSELLKSDWHNPFLALWENWVVIVPAILGILMFSRFFSKISWVSRIPIAFVIGAGAGISVPNTVQANIIKHTSATMSPFFQKDLFSWSQIMNFLNPIIIVLGVVSVLIYFFFSIEQKKGLKTVSWIGIVFLMIFFGASFGYTVMGRVSLVIGRVRFLIVDWSPLIGKLFGIGS
jgi:hypothetical protein